MSRHHNLRRVFVMMAVLIGVVLYGHATVLAQPTKPPLFAVLLGGNEVSNATGAANAGDPDGNGSFTAILDGRTLCFGIAVNGIATPTLLHIHENVAGLNGSPVVDLTALRPMAGDPGASSGCVTINDRELLARLRSSPSGFYVNIHTEEFPGGALRGQLF